MIFPLAALYLLSLRLFISEDVDVVVGYVGCGEIGLRKVVAVRVSLVTVVVVRIERIVMIEEAPVGGLAVLEEFGIRRGRRAEILPVPDGGRSAGVGRVRNRVYIRVSSCGGDMGIWGGGRRARFREYVREFDRPVMAARGVRELIRARYRRRWRERSRRRMKVRVRVRVRVVDMAERGGAREGGRGAGGGAEEDGRSVVEDTEGLASGEGGEGGAGGAEGTAVVGLGGGEAVASVHSILHEAATLLAPPNRVLVVQLRRRAPHFYK